MLCDKVVILITKSGINDSNIFIHDYNRPSLGTNNEKVQIAVPTKMREKFNFSGICRVFFIF